MFANDGSADGSKRRVFEQGGVKVLVDSASFELLQGAQIDYAESMISSSFQVVSNPNSEASCSCGTSFVAKA
jgi:iron-sulfur cluster assembly accessory protein